MLNKTRSRQILLFLFCIFTFFSTLPIYHGQMPSEQTTSKAEKKLPGLKAEVVVNRDERGISYIQARSDEDLYFTQGYITASDRLWQMDLLRRTARGELAEIFGAPALEEDKRRRLFGYARISESLVEKLRPDIRAMLDSYMLGVNAYLRETAPNELPIEFRILQSRPRDWTLADSLVIGKLFAEDLSTSWTSDLARAAMMDLPPKKREELLPVFSPLDVILVGNDRHSRKPVSSSKKLLNKALPKELLSEAARIENTLRRSRERVGLYSEGRAASNNWVVSGKRTVMGKPLLANDPHLLATAPSIWHMVFLESPSVRVAGVTVPGVPGIVIGHNNRIAWGVTNLGADVQDLYLEKFDPSNPDRYQTPEGWQTAETRAETIKVRKGSTGNETETVVTNITTTRHGPVVLESNGLRYSLRWTALENNIPEFSAFYDINRAGNWKEFSSALRQYPGPAQNFVYADVAGNIGYYAVGSIPQRSSGDGSVPYNGATEDGKWSGYIPFEQLPNVYNPPSGIIVTANNRVVGNSYRHHLTNEWESPYRARRIYDLLLRKPKLSAEDFRSIQRDAYSFADAVFTAEVVKSGKPLMNKSAEWRTIVQMFDGWDARSSADSRVMPLAAEMRNAFRRRVLTAAIGEEKANAYNWGNAGTFVDFVVTKRPHEWLPKEFDNYESLLLESYRDARRNLTETLGEQEENWIFGKTKSYTFFHPLAGAPLIGGRFAIEPLKRDFGGGGRTVYSGIFVSMRLIADLSNWDKTQQCIAPGQSGNPDSPHWKDQIREWQEVTPREFPFSQTAISQAARQTLRLMPE